MQLQNWERPTPETSSLAESLLMLKPLGPSPLNFDPSRTKVFPKANKYFYFRLLNDQKWLSTMGMIKLSSVVVAWTEISITKLI